MNQNQQEFHPFKSQKAKEAYLKYYDEKANQWPIASETKYVDTSFGQTFVRIIGPKNAPSLVLLPGDTVNSLDWMPLIEKLSKDYRTYALDQIFDNGRSIYSRPIKKQGDFVQWLDELFTELKLDHINLMGYSYGGWQASLYALSYPERLNKLILLSPASTVLRPRIKLIIRAILQYIFHTHYMAKKYIYWMYTDSVRKNEATKKYIDEMIAEEMLARKCFKKRKFVNPTVMSDKEWQNLKVHTLFLTGENEVIYSAEKAIQFLNTFAPNVKTAITSGAGHDLPIVNPEWVTTQVLKFLKS
ncbi:MAG: alpha/beta fold hydrolase [Promethearchaeota archaeon]|jgi:pimeloyl-ACP methyl ester carboxylesterase